MNGDKVGIFLVVCVYEVIPDKDKRLEIGSVIGVAGVTSFERKPLDYIVVVGIVLVIRVVSIIGIVEKPDKVSCDSELSRPTLGLYNREEKLTTQKEIGVEKVGKIEVFSLVDIDLEI